MASAAFRSLFCVELHTSETSRKASGLPRHVPRVLGQISKQSACPIVLAQCSKLLAQFRKILLGARQGPELSEDPCHARRVPSVRAVLEFSPEDTRTRVQQLETPASRTSPAPTQMGSSLEKMLRISAALSTSRVSHLTAFLRSEGTGVQP